MCRLRHSPFQGFPVCASRATCHASLLAPPSSNRTCGFPASGFPMTSRRRHLRLLAQLPSQKGEFRRCSAFCVVDISVNRHSPLCQLHVHSPAPSLHGRYPSLRLRRSPLRVPTSRLRYYERVRLPFRARRTLFLSSALLGFVQGRCLSPGRYLSFTHPGGSPRFLNLSLCVRCSLSPRAVQCLHLLVA